MLIKQANVLKRLLLNRITIEQYRTFLSAPLNELNEFPRTIDSYEKLYKFSLDQNEKFWSTIAKNRIEWFKLFDQTTSGKFSDENFQLRWFLNGKLNVSG